MRRVTRIYTSIGISHVKNYQLGHQEYIPKNNIPGLSCINIIHSPLARAVVLPSGIANEIFTWDYSIVRLRVDAAGAAGLDEADHRLGRSEGYGEIGESSGGGVAWNGVDPFRLFLRLGGCGEICVDYRRRQQDVSGASIYSSSLVQTIRMKSMNTNQLMHSMLRTGRHCCQFDNRSSQQSSC